MTRSEVELFRTRVKLAALAGNTSLSRLVMQTIEFCTYFPIYFLINDIFLQTKYTFK